MEERQPIKVTREFVPPADTISSSKPPQLYPEKKIVQEPAIEEPKVPEPTIEEPTIEEPKPISNEPTIEEPQPVETNTVIEETQVIEQPPIIQSMPSMPKEEYIPEQPKQYPPLPTIQTTPIPTPTNTIPNNPIVPTTIVNNPIEEVKEEEPKKHKPLPVMSSENHIPKDDKFFTFNRILWIVAILVVVILGGTYLFLVNEGHLTPIFTDNSSIEPVVNVDNPVSNNYAFNPETKNNYTIVNEITCPDLTCNCNSS